MTALNDKLHDYLLPCLKVPAEKFIEARNDITRPRKPYVDFQIISNGTIGSETRGPDEDGFQPIYHTKSLVVQLNFYGDDSAEDAEMFLLHLDMEATLTRGELLNFGLLDWTPPVDTSAEVAKTMERRYTVRVTLSHAAATLENVGLIKSVEIESTFK